MVKGNATMTIKQWLVTYAILLGSFVGTMTVGRQLYHNCDQPLWACMVVAVVVFIILTITILPSLPHRYGSSKEEQEKQK